VCLGSRDFIQNLPFENGCWSEEPQGGQSRSATYAETVSAEAAQLNRKMRTELTVETTRSESTGRNRGWSGYFEIILRSAAVIIIFPFISIVSPVIATVWLM
jgi:hypothetical protein